MRLHKWSLEVISIVIVAVVFVVAAGNSSQFSGMLVLDEEPLSPEEHAQELAQEFKEEASLEEGCEYVDVPYTESVCTDYYFNYSIRHEKRLRQRYGMQWICEAIVWLKNEGPGPGIWEMYYIFEVDNKTYKSELDVNYIDPEEEIAFIFQRVCDEDTDFDGTYFFEKEPFKYVCGPITKYKKEIKCHDLTS